MNKLVRKYRYLIIFMFILTSIFSFFYIKKRNEYKEILHTYNVELGESYCERAWNEIYTELGYKPKFVNNSNLKKVIDKLNSYSYKYSGSLNQGVKRIEIQTNKSYGLSFNKDEGYVKCDVTIYDVDGNILISDSDSQIKVRGNSTAIAPKKPYNIKFSEKVDLLNTGKSKKWSFLALYYDLTLLRDYTFQNLAKSIGLEYTSEVEYCDLVFDGYYMGTYLIIEPADSGKIGVDVDIDNGDFMIEYESTREEDGATYIEIGDEKLRFVINEPEEPNEDQLLNIKNNMDNVYNSLVSNDFSKVKEVIDIDSFAKMYIVNEFAKTEDFNYSSVKFYFKESKLYAGPVWDFDRSSGNTAYETSDEYWLNTSINKDSKYASYDEISCNVHLYKLLFEYDEFVNVIKEYYGLYKTDIENIYSDNGLIDQTVNKYKEIFELNYASRPDNGAAWIISEDYITYVDDLKQWLKNRDAYLSEIYLY